MAPRSFLPWPLPWPRRRDPPDEEEGEGAELPPVLLVPGIGGSILNAVTEDGKKSERIWVRLLNADHEFRSKLWSKYDPETGRTTSLSPNTHIEVPQDNFGLYACDILDPDLKIPLDMVNYYHNMIVDMRKWGYVDGKNLFGFGYDFRQSNRLPEVMDAFAQKLKSVHEVTGKKVSVITHSMGGLVMKSFVALQPSEVAAHVASWIAIASPFRGAPGFIMDTLLTGVEFLKGWQKELFVAKWSMHQLLVECPSVHELMAEYSFEWGEKPELRIVRTIDGSNSEETAVEVQKISTGEEVIKLLEEVLKNNSVTLNKETIPLPLNPSIVEWAKETRTIWSTAQLPEGVKFYNIYGVSLDTPFHTSYGSLQSPIKELEEILHTEAAFDYVDGDGTVPVESAKGDGFDAVFRVAVPGEHRALLRDDRVFRLVKYFLQVGGPDSLYDPVTDYVFLPTKEEVEADMESSLPNGNSDDDMFVERDVSVLVKTTNTEGVVTETVAHAHLTACVHTEVVEEEGEGKLLTAMENDGKDDKEIASRMAMELAIQELLASEIE